MTPEPNGHQDNLSRLDRIEKAMEHMVLEHELFRDEHKQLLRSQVVLQDSLRELKDRLDDTRGNLDALATLMDRDHREFHDRLSRLENRQ